MKPDDEADMPNAHERLRQRERVIMGKIPMPLKERLRDLAIMLVVSMITMGAAIFWAWVALNVGLWLLTAILIEPLELRVEFPSETMIIRTEEGWLRTDGVFSADYSKDGTLIRWRYRLTPPVLTIKEIR